MMRYGPIIGFAMALAAFDTTAAEALFAAASGAGGPSENATNPADSDARLQHEYPAPAAQEALPRGNPLWGIPLRTLTATQERPLFSPTRRPPRPPPPAAVVAAPQAPPPPKSDQPDHPPLSLVGTIVGNAEDVGIFFDETTKKVIRLKTTQDYAGWTLVSVKRREAVFGRDDRRATLTFPTPGQGQPTQTFQPAGSSPAAASSPIQLPAWLHGDIQPASPAPAQASLPGGGSSTVSSTVPLPAWLRGDGRSVRPPPIP